MRWRHTHNQQRIAAAQTVTSADADHDIRATATTPDVGTGDVADLWELRKILLDRRIGPVWWMLRYAPPAGQHNVTGEHLASILAAYDTVHQHLVSAERDYLPGLVPQIQHAIQTLIDDLREPDKLSVISDVLIRLLESALHNQDLADRLRAATSATTRPATG